MYALLRRKTQRAGIAAAIATAIKKERETVASLTTDAEKEAATIWGDNPPPMRTLDSYIQKARKIYEQEGAKLGTRGNYIFGVLYARNFEIYDKAIEGGNYSVAQRANEQLAELFGLNGAIKLHLTTDAPAAGLPDAVEGEAEFTLPQIVARMRLLRSVASQRKLASAEPQDAEVREA